MIVGTAYVEIHALTDKVRNEVKGGFQRGMKGVGSDAGSQFEQEMLPGIDSTGEEMKRTLGTKGGEAGDEAGTNFTDRMRRKVAAGGGGIGNTLRRMLGNAGGDSGDSFGKKFADSVEHHFENTSVRAKLIGSLTSFIPQALSLIGSVGGGLFAIGSAGAQAAGMMPVFYSTVASGISIMASAKLAFSGVSQAISAVASGSSAAAADMKALQPAQRAFVREIASLKPQLDALKQTAAKNLFPGLTAGIKAAEPLMGPFTTMVGRIDRGLGNAAASAGRLLGGPLRNEMQTIFRRNATAAGNLTGSLTPLVGAIVHLLHGISPVTVEFTALIRRGAEWANHALAAADSTGRLTGFFQQAFDRARQLGGILRNVATIVWNVAKAASNAGGTMLSSIERVTKGWADLTGTASTQNALQAWFQSTIPVMKEVAGIIGDIIKDIVHLGGSNKNLLPLLQQIRTQLVPALDKVLQATTGPVAASVVQFLTDLANIFAKISGAGSTGFLNSFVKSLDLVARGVNDVLGIPGVGKLAGILGGIAGAVSAFGFIAGRLKIISLAKNLLGFGDSAKVAAKGVDALKLSKMSEAEKLAMNKKLADENALAYSGMSGKIRKVVDSLKELARHPITKIRTIFSSGGAVGAGEAGAEGAAAGGIAGKAGGLLKSGIGKLGAAVGIGGAEEGGAGLAALFGGELSVPLIGEIAAAITLVGVAVYELVKHFGGVKTFFTKMLPDAFHTVVHWLGTAVDAIGHFFASLPRTAAHFIGQLPSLIGRLIKDAGHALLQGLEWAVAGAIVLFVVLPLRIGQALIGLARKIPGWIASAAEALWRGVKRGVDAAVGFFKSLPGRAADAIRSLRTKIGEVAVKAYDWLRTKTAQIIGDVVDWFKKLPGRAKNAIVHMPGQLMGVFRDVGNSILNAIRTFVPRVIGWFRDLPGKIVGALKNLGRDMYNIGKNLILSLLHGVTDFFGGVLSKVHSLISKIPFLHGSPSLVEMAPTLLTGVGGTIADSMADGFSKRTPKVLRKMHDAVRSMKASDMGVSPAFMSNVARGNSPNNGDPRWGGGVAHPGYGGPLLYVKELHVRDDRDIQKLENMLYRADQNIMRAAGRRAVVPTS